MQMQSEPCWPMKRDPQRGDIDSLGIQITFVRIPAGEFPMGSWNGADDNRPVSKVKIAKGFWMGEVEITNEQYNVISPIMTAGM